MSLSFSKELIEAKQAARMAGKSILEYYYKNYSIEIKKDCSEVTEADYSSHKIIVERLKKFAYPILSEEGEHYLHSNPSNQSSQSTDKAWIIDPLDGTSDFVNKDEGFSVMIALIENKRPIIGIVYLPLKDMLYFAQKGMGAYIEENGETKKINSSSNYFSSEHGTDYKAVLSKNHFTDKEKKFCSYININNFIRIGSIGVKLGTIAKGDAEIYFNFDGLNIWDTCAPQCILEEAGGEIFDLKGNELIYINDIIRFKNGIIATNGKNKSEILSKIEDFLKKI